MEIRYCDGVTFSFGWICSSATLPSLGFLVATHWYNPRGRFQVVSPRGGGGGVSSLGRLPTSCPKPSLDLRWACMPSKSNRPTAWPTSYRTPLIKWGTVSISGGGQEQVQSGRADGRSLLSPALGGHEVRLHRVLHQPRQGRTAPGEIRPSAGETICLFAVVPVRLVTRWRFSGTKLRFSGTAKKDFGVGVGLSFPSIKKWRCWD